jgi:hypothetical protein
MSPRTKSQHSKPISSVSGCSQAATPRCLLAAAFDKEQWTPPPFCPSHKGPFPWSAHALTSSSPTTTFRPSCQREARIATHLLRTPSSFGTAQCSSSWSDRRTGKWAQRVCALRWFSNKAPRKSLSATAQWPKIVDPMCTHELWCVLSESKDATWPVQRDRDPGFFSWRKGFRLCKVPRTLASFALTNRAKAQENTKERMVSARCFKFDDWTDHMLPPQKARGKGFRCRLCAPRLALGWSRSRERSERSTVRTYPARHAGARRGRPRHHQEFGTPRDGKLCPCPRAVRRSRPSGSVSPRDVPYVLPWAAAHGTRGRLAAANCTPRSRVGVRAGF